MQHIKRNIHQQVIRSIPIKHNEIGSYITFYLVGHNVPTVMKNFTDGTMSKDTIANLRSHNVAVFSKVGTVGVRNTGYDPYRERANELRHNFIYALRGQHTANFTTRAVYNYMKHDESLECFVLVCAIKTYRATDFMSYDGKINCILIESEMADFSRDNFNVDPDNDPMKIKATLVNKQRDQWGRKTLDVQVDI